MSGCEEIDFKCQVCDTYKTPDCDCKIVECVISGDSNHRFNMLVPKAIGRPWWNKADYDDYLRCHDCIDKEDDEYEEEDRGDPEAAFDDLEAEEY